MTERYLRALRAFTNELRAIRNEIHSANEKQQSGNNPGNNEPIPPVRVEVVATPQLDPARHEYYEAEKRERNSLWRKAKPWVEAIGVIVALTLAIVNYGTLREIQKQTPEISKSAKAAGDAAKAAEESVLQAKDQFRQDQRPYIWLMNNIPNPEFITSPKRPAQQVHFFPTIRLGDGPFRSSPGSPSGGSLGAPLPPNKDDFATVISEVITSQEWLRLTARTNTGNTIMVRLQYKYTDGTSSQAYESGMCFYRLNNGAIAYCREGNYIN